MFTDEIVIENITAITLSPHQVFLNWTLPVDKVPCVDGYSVFWNEVIDGGITTSRDVAVNNDWYTVTQLDACRQYLFNLYLHRDQKVLGLGGSVNASTTHESK